MNEDLISRQAALDAVEMVIGDNRSISICEAIRQLPCCNEKAAGERHNIRVIKEGDINKLFKMKQFRCLKCGCIFEANNKEYRWYDRGQYYDSGFECNCPMCGNWAYEYRNGKH